MDMCMVPYHGLAILGHCIKPWCAMYDLAAEEDLNSYFESRFNAADLLTCIAVSYVQDYFLSDASLFLHA